MKAPAKTTKAASDSRPFEMTDPDPGAAVLGRILADPDHALGLTAMLTPDDFYDGRQQRVFQAICEHGADQKLILKEISKAWEFDPTPMKFLNELDGAGIGETVERAIDELKRQARDRRLFDAVTAEREAMGRP